MEMEFFTWDYLATFAGALAVVVLLTQMFKDMGVLQKVPTQLVSWIIAYVVILLAQIFTNTICAQNAVLALFNSAMVSLAANGGFDAIKRIFAHSSEDENETDN